MIEFIAQVSEEDFKKIQNHETVYQYCGLVRCKDCLMTEERDKYKNKVWCFWHREYVDDMYYCADGLRREDGET